jgi:tRNA G10  N-methylase Trm11
MQPSIPSSIPKLAGIHKFAPLVVQVQEDGTGIEGFADKVADQMEEATNFSLSGYGIKEDDYEELLQLLLDTFRSRGLRKIHLLRPEGNELHADRVVSRGSIDAVTFPYHNGFYLGLTSYVPDHASMRERGVMKPAPHSEISLSPRLARVLVNLSGLVPGQTLLDPFCGSGTILAEGLLKSLRCIGIDSRRGMVKEAKLNLRWLSGKSHVAHYKLSVGDATRLREVLGETKVDAVVSEPILLPGLKSRPNLETAKEMMDNAGDVYTDALVSIADAVRPQGRIVIVVPVIRTADGNEIHISLDGKPLGLTLLQPGPNRFEYPVRLSFESTRWVRRAVYVFEVRP